MGSQYIHLAWFLLCHVFNFCDAVLTLAAISKGIEEANPVMAWALSISPVFFLAAKFIIFSVALGFIFRRAPALLAPIGIVYMTVLAWHAYFWLAV